MSFEKWVVRSGVGGGGFRLSLSFEFFFFYVSQSSNAINWYFKNQPKHNFIFSVTNSKGLSFQPLKCHYCHGMAKLDLKKTNYRVFRHQAFVREGLAPKCVEKRLGFCAISVFTVYVSISKEHLLETWLESRNRSYLYMFFDNLFFVNK